MPLARRSSAIPSPCLLNRICLLFFLFGSSELLNIMNHQGIILAEPETRIVYQMSVVRVCVCVCVWGGVDIWVIRAYPSKYYTVI